LKMSVYAAQVEVMDRGIGRIIALLRNLKAEENTLILFLSDNGAAASNLYETSPGKLAAGIPAGPADSYTSYGLHWASVSNTPFSFYKTWTGEGGISTPLIVSWPGRTRDPGGFSDNVVHVMDVAATLLEAAGTTYPAQFNGRMLGGIEGRSFLPSVQGKSTRDHAELAWTLYGNKAIRRGDWKLVSRSPEHLTASFQRWRYPPAAHTAEWQLFNLAADRSECTDLAAANPAKVQQLAAAYVAWSKHVNVPDTPVGEN
jgi:arylsulfatase A-like enzyme